MLLFIIIVIHRFYGPQVPFGADLPDIQCALDHPGLRWIRRPNIVLDGDQTLLCTTCPENTIYLKSNWLAPSRKSFLWPSLAWNTWSGSGLLGAGQYLNIANINQGSTSQEWWNSPVTDSIVKCPSRWSLYLSLALCVDHLVGSGKWEPYIVVFSSPHHSGPGWPFCNM